MRRVGMDNHDALQGDWVANFYTKENQVHEQGWKDENGSADAK
jgi:hypothetical protein